MKRLAITTAILFVTAVGALVARSHDGADRWQLASGGHTPIPLATVRLADGRYELRAYVDEDGVPNITYFTPRQGGGRRLVAVGDKGGWAVEPQVIHAPDRDIVYGATIVDAAQVRVRAGSTQATAVTKVLHGLDYRYFVIVTDTGVRVRSSHDVEAFDSSGRLLGRGHDNDGTGGQPDLGAYDGRWDRAHQPPLDLVDAG